MSATETYKTTYAQIILELSVDHIVSTFKFVLFKYSKQSLFIHYSWGIMPVDPTQERI